MYAMALFVSTLLISFTPPIAELQGFANGCYSGV